MWESGGSGRSSNPRYGVRFFDLPIIVFCSALAVLDAERAALPREVKALRAVVSPAASEPRGTARG
ncbi:hypothetical protein [Amycolatopsis sp. cmx-11-12]|uniref:hypothetical protein n=1 Tax=Amycolatopsis sp. cmx-11-12 TaxID=2785795 RepID=UPI003916E5B4